MSRYQFQLKFRRYIILYMPKLRELVEQNVGLNTLRHEGTNYEALYKSEFYKALKKQYGYVVHLALRQEVNYLLHTKSLLQSRNYGT